MSTRHDIQSTNLYKSVQIKAYHKSQIKSNQCQINENVKVMTLHCNESSCESVEKNCSNHANLLKSD